MQSSTSEAARLDLLKKLYGAAEKLLGVARDNLSADDPKFMGLCEESLTVLRNFISAAPSVAVEPSSGTTNATLQELENMYNFYTRIDAVMSACGVLRQLAASEKYARSYLHGISSSYESNFRIYAAMVAAEYERVMAVSAKINDEIYEKINAVINSIGVTDIIIFLGKVTINSFIIDLIAAIYPVASQSQKYKLDSIIEGQKNLALGAGVLDMTAYNAVQQISSRLRLIPAAPSGPFTDILGLLGLDSTAATTVEDLPAALGANVMVINKWSRNVIEFDIRGLIDEQYVSGKGFNVPMTSGLTRKIVARYNTTIQGEPQDNPPYKIKYLPAPGSTDSTYVLETLDGANFRVMSYRGSIKISNDDLRGLFNRLSTRPWKYNNLQEETILSRCFDPKSDYVFSVYTTQEKAIRSAPVRDKIKADLVDIFIGKTIPKNPADYIAMVTDQQMIFKVITRRLIEEIDVNSRKSRECMLTYIVKINDVAREFITLLTENLKRANIPESRFGELRGKDLTTYLAGTLGAAIVDAMEALEKNDEWTGFLHSIKESYIKHRAVGL